MYYTHFGLNQAPFKITPNTDIFFSGGQRGAILEALLYAITHGEGIIKVTGEVGSGKTMLCAKLQTQLPPTISTIYIANPNLSPTDVLYAIAEELHLPAQGSRFSIIRMLQNDLLARHAAGQQVLLLIEESQSMPIATLEEIRLLSNLETKTDKLMQIILFGQPELDTLLAETAIRPLKDRISHSFHLAPLNAQDIAGYLSFRLHAAGYSGPTLFGPRLVRRIAAASEGLGRRINMIADKTLLAAFAENATIPNLRHVQTALDDQALAPHRKAQQLFAIRYGLYGLALCISGLILGTQFYTQRQQVTSPTPQPAPAVSQPEPPQYKNNIIKSNIYNKSSLDLAAQLAATNQWLAQSPPSTYTLQLMSLRTEQQWSARAATIAIHLDLDHIHVYRSSIQGQPGITITWGSFPNITQAEAALKQLPSPLLAAKPIMRTVAGIMREQRESASQTINNTPENKN